MSDADLDDPDTGVIELELESGDPLRAQRMARAKLAARARDAERICAADIRYRQEMPTQDD